MKTIDRDQVASAVDRLEEIKRSWHPGLGGSEELYSDALKRIAQNVGVASDDVVHVAVDRAPILLTVYFRSCERRGIDPFKNMTTLVIASWAEGFLSGRLSALDEEPPT